MRRVVLFCHRHAGWVIAAWLVVLVGLTLADRALGSDYRDTVNLPASDSSRAQDLLSQVQGGVQAGDSERIVFATSRGSVTDAQIRARIDPMLARVAGLPHVTQVISPYSPQGQPQVAGNGRVAFATVSYSAGANKVTTGQARQLVDVARSAGQSGLTVEVSGQVAMRASPPSLGGAYIGLLAAAVVLLVTFGSLFSMLMPVLTAAVSVGSGVAVVGLLTHVMNVAQVSPQITALMGLGVGVDYALFIVTRYRQGIKAGRTPEDALGAAAVTSGRSVLFAGLTVCVALLGMFTVRLNFLYGIAIGSSVAVLLTMLAALTLLPALLRVIGKRVLSRRERRRLADGRPQAEQEGRPQAGREGRPQAEQDGRAQAEREGRPRAEKEGRAWSRWARAIIGRPVTSTLATVAAIVLLALPLLSMRLGISDAGLDPKGSTTRAAYDLLAEGFGPGYTGPLVITGRMDRTGAREAVQGLAAGLAHHDDVARVPPAVFAPARDGGTVAVLTVYPASSPQDEATADLVRDLRARVIPQATDGTGTRLYVGGTTAVDVDFSQALTDRLPLFIATVVGISFILLTIVFRSLLVPLTAALMNLLAAGAAFGILTAVFEWGWAGSLIGVDRTGPIEPYLPVLLFAGLFGLSMDYEVFLVGRIQEEWHRLRDNRAAVVRGLAATGRTITAAAIIMVLVFASFVMGGNRVVKIAGLGLASAVLLDAVVIRSLLVPAVMALLGRSNWWLPRWLGRALPTLSLEEEPTGADAPVAAEPAPVGR
ncbi:MMPL family transporter [Rugosimonospora africana]|uniref:Membrane protein n=1 Tax=Rugosimonospora africana TaxID=556532 RepID=A0A8J3QRV5_9ACTN|nr:MMPL family transporter [Rugosimonospora africana]GIH14525.1 membrane protein [Rugosimonospora africana]